MIRYLNFLAKALLLGLLLFALFNLEMDQFQGKGMIARITTYPLATVLVPLIWYRFFRDKAYPHGLDLLLVTAFLIDVGGNTIDLYDSVVWFDDFVHFFNGMILTFGFATLLFRTKLSPIVVFGLALGFGSFLSVMWEFAEYIIFIRDSPEYSTAYVDTLGDLALEHIGAFLAAGAAFFIERRKLRA